MAEVRSRITNETEALYELLDALRDSVELLAAPPATQDAWLRTHGFPVDELALQLDDEVPGWLPRLAGAGLLTVGAQEALRNLHGELGALSGTTDSANAILWTEESLYGAEQWRRVRELAQEALITMGLSA